MSLSGIISVSGLPGLHKVLSQTKNGLIVESLIDEKRRPIYSSQKVSALEDISVYTHGEDIPLKDVFKKMHEKQAGKKAPNHKEKPEVLRKYIGEIVEDIDHDRVYNSDVAKLFQWYNLLVDKKLLTFEEEGEAEGEEKKPAKKTAAGKAGEKKTKAAASKEKEPAEKKTPAKKPASTAKKTETKAPKKVGTSKSAPAAKSAAPARRTGRKS